VRKKAAPRRNRVKELELLLEEERRKNLALPVISKEILCAVEVLEHNQRALRDQLQVVVNAVRALPELYEACHDARNRLEAAIRKADRETRAAYRSNFYVTTAAMGGRR
jgi:hypothetical protein